MLSYISHKNLFSSSLLVLSFFLLSPEGKAMKEDILENVKADPRTKKGVTAVPLKFKKLYAQEYIEKDGTLTITTKNDNRASYQTETNRVKVTPGEVYEVPYDITVEDGGKVAFGVLNSARNGWIGGEVSFLEPKSYTGVKEILIPQGESEISLVLLNYHLGTAGQSTFTAKLGLEKVEVQKSIISIPEKTGNTIPLKFKKAYAKEYKENNGTIEITTDNNNRASYQAITDRVKVTAGEKFQIPYDITVEDGGRMAFGVLNTKGDGWIGGEVILETGKHKSVKEILIPQGESLISLVLRNYHLETPGQSKFRAKLGLERVETSTISHPSLPKNLPLIPKITFKDYFGYLFEGIYQDDNSETEWMVLNGDLLAERIVGEMINENTAFSTPQSTLLSVNDIDSLKKKAGENDFKGDPKKYIQLMDLIEKNIEKDEKAFFVIFDFNYDGKKSIKESVIFVYKEKENVKNEPFPSVSKNSSLSWQLKSLINTVANVFAKEGKKNITQVDITNLLNKKPEFARKSIQTRIDSINQVLGEFGFLNQVNEKLIEITNFSLCAPKENKNIISNNANINFQEIQSNTENDRLEVENIIPEGFRVLLPFIVSSAKKNNDVRPPAAIIRGYLDHNEGWGLWEKLSLKGQNYLVSLCAPEENKNIISNNINNFNNTNINFQGLQSNTEDARLEVEKSIPNWLIQWLPNVVKEAQLNKDPRSIEIIIKGVLDNNGGQGLWNQLSLKGKDYLINLCAPEENKNIISNNINNFNNTNINFQGLQSNTESSRLEVEELINKDVVNDLSLAVSNIRRKDSIRPAGEIIKNYLENFVQVGIWEKLSLGGQKYLVSLCDPEKKKEIVFEPIRKNIIEERFDPRNQIHVKPQINPFPNDYREQNREVLSYENEEFLVYNVSTVQVNCGYFTLDTTREKAREVLQDKKFNYLRKGDFSFINFDEQLQRQLQYDAIRAESLCIIGRYVVGVNIRVFGKKNHNNKLNLLMSTQALGIEDPNLPTINILNENVHYKILVPTDNTEENNLLRDYGRKKEDLELKDKEIENRLAYIEDNNVYEREYEKWGKSHFLNNEQGGWLKSYVEWVKSRKK
jgi:hypothetical protein